MAIATFGHIARTLDGQVLIPVNIDKAVYAITRSNFDVINVTENGIEGIADYEFYGPTEDGDRNFRLIFEFLDDTEGIFLVRARNNVKHMSQTEILSSSVDVYVSYATHVPFIQNYDVPSTIEAGKIFDILLGFGVDVSELGVDDFIYEGVNPGSPKLYRSAYTGLWRNLPSLPRIGDIFRYEGSGWDQKGNLLDVDFITSISSISLVSDADDFNNASDTEGAILIIADDISSGITKEDAAGDEIDSATKGDVFRYLASWDSAGNLTTLFSGIQSLGDISTITSTMPASVSSNDVTILASNTADLEDLNGWFISSNPSRSATSRSSLDETSRFFALRFSGPSESARGVFSLAIKDKSVRGPDGENTGLLLIGPENLDIPLGSPFSRRFYYYTSNTENVDVETTGEPAGFSVTVNNGEIYLVGSPTAAETGTLRITARQGSVTETLVVSWEIS